MWHVYIIYTHNGLYVVIFCAVNRSKIYDTLFLLCFLIPLYNAQYCTEIKYTRQVPMYAARIKI